MSPKEKEGGKETTLQDDLSQPSTHSPRTIERFKLLLWEYLRSRASLDSKRRKNDESLLDVYSHVIVSLSRDETRDADDENGESLRRGQAPFFFSQGPLLDTTRGPPVLYIAEVRP